jgi:hypothetical protein
MDRRGSRAAAAPAAEDLGAMDRRGSRAAAAPAVEDLGAMDHRGSRAAAPAAVEDLGATDRRGSRAVAAPVVHREWLAADKAAAHTPGKGNLLSTERARPHRAAV